MGCVGWRDDGMSVVHHRNHYRLEALFHSHSIKERDSYWLLNVSWCHRGECWLALKQRCLDSKMMRKALISCGFFHVYRNNMFKFDEKTEANISLRLRLHSFPPSLPTVSFLLLSTLVFVLHAPFQRLFRGWSGAWLCWSVCTAVPEPAIHKLYVCVYVCVWVGGGCCMCGWVCMCVPEPAIHQFHR